MPNPIYTGNSLLDALSNGPYVKNPNYNPKTKAGKSQPSVLVNTAAGEVHGGAVSKTSEATRKIAYTFNDTGADLAQIKRDEELGITYSPYNTEEELNHARSEKQSAAAQFGNAVERAVYGEMVLGTLEGLGDIVDGIANIFTQGEWGQSGWSKYWQDVKQENEDNHKIYQYNPGETFAWNDFGWWMENAISTATTVSLMLPAAGWARGIGLVGKLTKADKLLNWATRGISKGILRAASKAPLAKEFSALKNIDNTANKLTNFIRNNSEIMGTAFLSRSGENMMEANQTYQETYESSKNNLDNMNDAEFNKFIANNPKFANMSKDDIAKEISKESMMKTFYNDYWMLAMDIPQFKALGSLWKGTGMRATSIGERIAAENVKRKLAGKTEEELIKNIFKNRLKYGLIENIKHPLSTWSMLELGEGFEEGFQGIQQEKGKEVAKKYFNPNFTERSLNSYLNDSSIWEQAFWGAIGGIVFKHAGEGIKSISHKAEAAYKKKHMSADEYERWKKTGDEIAIEELNGITASAAAFAQEMSDINDGKNPYQYKRDVSTGMPIIENGQYQNAELKEDEKELLKQDALKKFIDNTAFTAIDRGNFDLIKDIVGGTEFDKYLKEKGVDITQNDNLLSQQIVRRMNMIDTYYSTALSNFNAINSDTNPYAVRAAAQDIARKQLDTNELNDLLNNIDYKLGQISPKGSDYSRYSSKELYGKINKIINQLNENNAQIEEQYKNKEITKSVRDTKINQNNKYINNLVELAATNTEEGQMQDIKNKLKKIDKNNTSLSEDFNKWYADYINFLSENFNENPYAVPGNEVTKTIGNRHDILINDAFIKADIPVSQEEFTDLYNEYIDAFDTYRQNKLNKYFNDVKAYLKNSKDLDEAIDKVYNESTGNKSLDKKIMALKFGYTNPNNQMYTVNNMLRSGELKKYITELRREKNKAAESARAAEEEGVLPSEKEIDRGVTAENNNTENNNETTEQTQVDNNLSTGEEIQADETVVTPTEEQENQLYNLLLEQQAKKQQEEQQNAVEQTKKPVEEKPVEEKQTKKEDILINSKAEDDLLKAMGADPNLRIKVNEKPVNTNDVSAALSIGDSTNVLDAQLRSIIQKQFLTNGVLLKAIIEDYKNNKQDTLFNYIVSLTKELKYPTDKQEFIMQRILVNIIDSVNYWERFIRDPTKKKRMGELAKAIIFKVDEKTAPKYSATEIISGKALNEVIENFLADYSIWIDNNTITDENGNTKSIINLNELFNYLLEDDSISGKEIEQIINNMFEYIANNNEEKYIFTGLDVLNNRDNFEEYLNKLRQEKQKLIAERNKLHIGRFKAYNANGGILRLPADYNEILLKIANNKATVTCEFDAKKNHIIYKAHYEENSEKKIAPIAIMATIDMSPDATRIMPKNPLNGFTNVINVVNGTNRLNNYNFFTNLINQSNASYKELFNTIFDYYYNQLLISRKVNQKLIDIKEANEELKKVNDKIINIVKNNEVFQKVTTLDSVDFMYNLYGTDNTDNEINNFIEDVGNILFFDIKNKGQFLNSSQFDNAHFDKKTMLESYEQWNNSVYQNYIQTYELQKQLKENNFINIKVNVPYYVLPNPIPEGEPRINLGDNVHDPSTFVYIDTNHRIINEKGEDLGYYSGNTESYSMGFLVYNKDGTKYIDFVQDSQQLNDDKKKQLKKHFASIIKMQFDKDVSKDATETFEEIGKLLSSIIGGNEKEHNYKTLFHIGNANGSFSRNTGMFHVYDFNDSNSKKIPILTIYKYHATKENKNNPTPSNAITVRLPNSNQKVTINDATYKLSKLTDEEVANNQELYNRREEARKKIQILNDVTDYIFADVSFNKTTNGFTGKTASNSDTLLFNRNNGKFNTIFDNESYSSYGDFLIKNRAFNSNMDGNKSFVKYTVMDQRLSVDLKYQENINVTTNNAVSDILFNDNITRKTIPTKDVLKAAGVDEESINTIIKFTTKVVTPVDGDEKANTRGFYKSNKTGGVHITKKGAASMNGQPLEAIRIILHENVHRMLNNKKDYSKTQYNRIIKEMSELRQYTIDSLNDTINNIDNEKEKDLYNKMLNVLNAYKGDNEQIRVEEFIAESLSQPMLIEYLNNTNYKQDTNIDEIAQSKKSILQKLMDILLKLFGINDNINKSSILAKEYEILGKKYAERNNTKNNNESKSRTKKVVNAAQKSQINSPVEGTLQHINPIIENTNNQNQDNTNIENNNSNTNNDSAEVDTTVNVEKLNEAEKAINDIEKYFTSRVKRSDNFEKDHTYYLDGDTKIDTSVTQSIHGKEEIDEQWGNIASGLGNTVDEANRLYFDDRNKLLSDDHIIPNYIDSYNATVEENQLPNSKGQLINDIKKIEKYLDNKFGAGHYKVITREFPIAGRIKIDGEFKTVAGTMDMIVITDDGNIHIYDFKTNRINSSAKMSDKKIEGYTKQLNIYKQLIINNFGDLKDKVKIEGLIVYNTAYLNPSDDIKYTKNKDNQVYITQNGELQAIEDRSDIYTAPYFTDNFERDNFIPIKDIEGIENDITKLPDIENKEIKEDVKEEITDDTSDKKLSSDDFDKMLWELDALPANTELIRPITNTDIFTNETDVDIYVNAINDDNTNDSYGVQFANNMEALIMSYPIAFRDSLKQSLANNELQYVCS